MNTELIGQSWDKLVDKHQQLVSTFYSRFFEEYPDYKALFPGSMDRHMKKMVDTMAFVARVAEDTEIAHPHLMKLGDKHREYELGKQDLDRFKKVFLNVIGEYCGRDWTSECQDAWTEAFDRHVIPYMMRGLKHRLP
jgi:hemoglobin-like flavoprotein